MDHLDGDDRWWNEHPLNPSSSQVHDSNSILMTRPSFSQVHDNSSIKMKFPSSSYAYDNNSIQTKLPTPRLNCGVTNDTNHRSERLLSHVPNGLRNVFSFFSLLNVQGIMIPWNSYEYDLVMIWTITIVSEFEWLSRWNKYYMLWRGGILENKVYDLFFKYI